MGIFNGNNNQTPPPNGDTGKAKTFTYRCAESCTYGGKFYREGDTIVLPEQKEVPHFKPVEKTDTSDGK
ncbi:MAG: hypothetical protein LBH20_03640 [Treponema sp.]|jgi:hypothetical protein|nr:hypothetical protein [Treponema sp.]